ncbi:zinc finger BED domain-containing protein DAYSLEEPER-like [Aphidius gifuensis]|uniref:zinc finger BED domain-containing protein DAYSLEEPER-like n=1 Tax=Aphidius gifuensis TaxID=684658 RepID=UPI001CDB5914|nr:zinc finger BED domain-containing protein DAYSLEEPER-like [Aphidius gifuensis]
MLKHYYKTNWVYCAVLILDPRHKIDTFSATSWGLEMKQESVEHFNKSYRDYHVSMKTETSHVEENVVPEISEKVDDENDSIDFSSLYEDSPKSVDFKAELDGYLALKRATKDQNILDWWKVHEHNFPTLSRMARDLFSIMATSVPSERLFSVAGLVMTKTRNSLNDESVRALLCLHSWLDKSL